MPGHHTPRQNYLLAALPARDSERLYPHLELVPLPLGEVLYESGDELRHVYFPTDSIVSLLYVMANGSSAEIAVVGNEGIIGIALFTGGETMPNRAVVQSAGYVYRLKGQLLKEEFNRAGELQHLLLRYTQALLTQMSQTAVCNRHHTVDQQLCRWLLLSLDRLPSNGRSRAPSRWAWSASLRPSTLKRCRRPRWWRIPASSPSARWSFEQQGHRRRTSIRRSGGGP